MVPQATPEPAQPDCWRVSVARDGGNGLGPGEADRRAPVAARGVGGALNRGDAGPSRERPAGRTRGPRDRHGALGTVSCRRDSRQPGLRRARRARCRYGDLGGRGGRDSPLAVRLVLGASLDLARDATRGAAEPGGLARAPGRHATVYTWARGGRTSGGPRGSRPGGRPLRPLRHGYSPLRASMPTRMGLGIAAIVAKKSLPPPRPEGASSGSGDWTVGTSPVA